MHGNAETSHQDSVNQHENKRKSDTRKVHVNVEKGGLCEFVNINNKKV